MKYISEIIINLPIAEVITKLDNADNMKYWQKGLIGYKFLDDTPGTEGSKMELEYLMGKRNMVLTETILKNDFPSQFHATYEAKDVLNIQKNYFYKIDAQTTKWVSENEFRFSSFMMKAIGFIMPGSFKKQSLKYLNDFKNFAENGVSVVEQS